MTLANPEDFPLWSTVLKAEMQRTDCLDIVEQDLEPPNKDLVLGWMLAEGWENPSQNEIAKRVHEERERYKKARNEAFGLMRNTIHRGHLNTIRFDETPYKMWQTIEKTFKRTSPVDIGRAVNSACSSKLSSLDDIEQYCDKYQQAYDKIAGILVNYTGEVFTHKSVEAVLQGSLLDNLRDFHPHIAQMERNWSECEDPYLEASIRDTIAEVKKYVKKDPGLAMITHRNRSPNKRRFNDRPPIGTCKQAECVSRNATNHYEVDCWTLYPEKRPSPQLNRKKFSINQLKPRGSTQDLKGKGTEATAAITGKKDDYDITV
jgi:hypothetical protein